ncbi:hypothetical protein [Streptomyces sp. NBC_00038]|uniref:hypothetical protein n=1 Tax=Streptomyces sp. NBC_00038 TaxID=2903615 RepID=UPI002252917F|nr:hypothetical protein [Streptomyces sp. NBC_00038]MCX5554922.1 hypothetical protein [Streptomyces sp. NBC_00038]
MHDVPIYAQLISERGDIPLQVRTEARRIQRELDWIVNAGPASGGFPSRPPAAPLPNSRALPPGSGSTGWLS